MQEALKFYEIETKYRADDIERLAFKDLARTLSGVKFEYIESYDIYYTRGDNEFLRYRYSEDKREKRAELTFKKKHNQLNNIIRTEVNLRVDANSMDTVAAFSEGLGYELNFSIWKLCDIYKLDDAVLVYYSVKDEEDNYQNFIEIEVKEGLPKTEEEAWNIINKYEKLIEPLGISPHNRLKKSLFEMYKK